MPDRKASSLELHATPAGFVEAPEVPMNPHIGGGKKNNEEFPRGTVVGTEKNGSHNQMSQQTCTLKQGPGHQANLDRHQEIDHKYISCRLEQRAMTEELCPTKGLVPCASTELRPGQQQTSCSATGKDQ